MKNQIYFILAMFFYFISSASAQNNCDATMNIIGNGITRQIQVVPTNVLPTNSSVHTDFGDGTFESNLNSTHTYTTSGTYTVCNTIQIFSDSIVLCTNTICDTVNIIIPTNINTLLAQENTNVHLTPNPTCDIVKVDLEGGYLEAVYITDLFGRVLTVDTVISNSIGIGYLGNLSSGIYLINIKTSNGELIVKPVMKQ